jgi:hypothetical protein
MMGHDAFLMLPPSVLVQEYLSMAPDSREMHHDGALRRPI